MKRLTEQEIKFIKETDTLREKTIDKFFKYVRNHYMNWWD